MSDFDVAQLRRLQHAANMLSLRQFCEALGLELDSYAKDKYEAFRRLGELGRFDDGTLRTLVAFYEPSRETQ